MAFVPVYPCSAVGGQRDGRPIEWALRVTALVYFGRRRMEVVRDRPIVMTDRDVIARVDRVHRCGTDVKIFQAGRPDQCEESLLDELRSIFACDAPPGDVPFAAYVDLALGGPADATIDDLLYRAVASRITEMSPADRARLPCRGLLGLPARDHSLHQPATAA